MTAWHLRHAAHGDKPWAVQAEALRRADGRDRYGYFLEQGLGKTALTLNEYVDRDDIDLCIIIAPQSFKLDWPLAPEEWGVGFLRAGAWPRDPLPYDWEHGIYALNYEAISRSRAKEPVLKLLEQRRCMLVIDESKALGNPGSGFTKSVIELAKRAKVVRELNGTPITQNVMDYYGQLRALGELNGWNPVAFRNRFAVLGGFMGKQIMPEFKNGDELARILDRCSFRALKSDWRKDLPEKTYSTVHLEMTSEQLSRYRTMMEEFYALVDDDGAMITAELVLTQMDKLRQISSGILIESWLDENSRRRSKTHVFLEPKVNPKLKAVLELVGEQGKAIIVYHYVESGKVLLNALHKAGLEPAVIRGGMDTADIVTSKQRFNTDPACRVIIGQTQAIALGHTLLGQPGKDRCNKVIFYENSYSLYYRLQVEDRNHRGEQDQMCSVIDLITSPMDEATTRILTSKREMAQSMDEIVAAVRAEKRNQ